MVLLRIRLVDADTGAPIAFATVGVDGASGVTDHEGYVEFDLPPREYTVHVKVPYYAPAKARVRCPGSYTIKLRSLIL